MLGVLNDINTYFKLFAGRDGKISTSTLESIANSHLDANYVNDAKYLLDPNNIFLFNNLADPSTGEISQRNLAKFLASLGGGSGGSVSDTPGVNQLSALKGMYDDWKEVVNWMNSHTDTYGASTTVASAITHLNSGATTNIDDIAIADNNGIITIDGHTITTSGGSVMIDGTTETITTTADGYVITTDGSTTTIQIDANNTITINGGTTATITSSTTTAQATLDEQTLEELASDTALASGSDEDYNISQYAEYLIEHPNTLNLLQEYQNSGETQGELSRGDFGSMINALLGYQACFGSASLSITGDTKTNDAKTYAVLQDMHKYFALFAGGTSSITEQNLHVILLTAV